MGYKLYHCECQECGDIWDKEYHETTDEAGVYCRNCYSEDVDVTKVNTIHDKVTIKELINE